MYDTSQLSVPAPKRRYRSAEEKPTSSDIPVHQRFFPMGVLATRSSVAVMGDSINRGDPRTEVCCDKNVMVPWSEQVRFDQNACRTRLQTRCSCGICRVCHKCAVPFDPRCAKVHLFNTASKRFRAGLAVGKSLIRQCESWCEDLSDSPTLNQ